MGKDFKDGWGFWAVSPLRPSPLGSRVRGNDVRPAARPPRAYPARVTSFARAPFALRKGRVWC